MTEIDLRHYAIHIADDVEPVYEPGELPDDPPVFKGYRVVRGQYVMREKYINRTVHIDKPAVITSGGNTIHLAPGFSFEFGDGRLWK